MVAEDAFFVCSRSLPSGWVDVAGVCVGDAVMTQRDGMKAIMAGSSIAPLNGIGFGTWAWGNKAVW